MSGTLARKTVKKTGPGPIAQDSEDGGDDGGRKLVVTLGSEAAAATRRMAQRLKVNPPETVRRGLMLLDMWLSLDPDEELVIRSTKTGEISRLRFHWGY
jgi:hypothetical protein